MTPQEIRQARKSLGLTQDQLATLTGLARKDGISMAELGKSQPHGAVVRLLRAYLDGYRPSDWPEQG